MAKRGKGAVARVVDEDDDYEEVSTDALTDPGEMIADNASDSPIFADVDGRSLRSITKLKLYKHEPGGPPAYKGLLPLSTTLDSIGITYGNGIYNIEGLNNKHAVLAVKENVRISLGTLEDQNKDRQLQLPGTSEPERIERLARLSADESQANSREFIQMVLATSREAAERERAFMADGRKQQTDFFAGMMAMQQQGFQQLITMMNTQHAMALKERNASRPSDDNPMRFAEILMQGIRVGRDLEPGDEQAPPWMSLVNGGMNMLASVAKANQTQLAAPNPSGLATLSPKKRKKLAEAVRLYKKVRASGIDPDALLARLSEAGPVQVAESPSPDPDDEDDEDDSETFTDDDALDDDDDAESDSEDGEDAD